MTSVPSSQVHFNVNMDKVQFVSQKVHFRHPGRGPLSNILYDVMIWGHLQCVFLLSSRLLLTHMQSYLYGVH